MSAGEEEYSQGELVRWLQRVEAAINGFKDEVVAKGVYEAERKADRDEVSDLRRRFDSFVGRAWWLFGLAITTAIAVVGLYVKGKG